MNMFELTKALDFISDNTDEELQLQTLRVFLFVATRGGCSQKDIEERLNLTSSSVSRNVSYWTERRFDRKIGLDFIERTEDNYDRRYKKLCLTQKGQEFFNKLKSI